VSVFVLEVAWMVVSLYGIVRSLRLRMARPPSP